MSFYDFMLSNYLNDASAEGDLADDMKHEQATFPRSEGNEHDEHDEHDEIQRYLLMRHACPKCLEVFEHCWKEYMKGI